MDKFVQQVLMAVILLTAACAARAGDLSDIENYREYSPSFSSAGQPGEEQFGLLKREGFERIVYIAFNSSRGAVENEDQVAKDLGMDYVQVPVAWEKPLKSDFYAFAGAMQQEPQKKTLLHCQANYRASAFAFLYRVLYQGVPVAEAKAAMNSVWQPDETWKELIFDVLHENGISPDCESCDWSSET
ncbi:MAG: protein tyrosine phosphatase family protein [Xanthomonadales bacterium]|jgi:protein tyrosine phosphatase (PTP) superfamily phosphohydrolase (DUF442 family)|nr:protein tyrosine phosphatase family protein [Xanthomonadales bacterium]